MSTTAREARRALAKALDDIETYKISSSTGSTSTIPGLINFTTGASPARFDPRWIFIAEGFAIGTQNAIKADGYDPATGVVTPLQFWDTTPHANDVADLTGLFPSVGYAGATSPAGGVSYYHLINEAARLLIEPDYIDVVTVANQQAYPLTAQARWLDRPMRVTGVWDPPRDSGWPRTRTSRRWEIRFDGGTPSLVFLDRAYSQAGHTFQISVMRPGDTLVNGAESSTGVVAETDTLLSSVEDLVDVGLYLAYRTLLHRSFGRPSGNWSELLKDQETRVLRLAKIDMSRFNEIREQQAQQPRQRQEVATNGAA
jgi:hypothetical protein